MTTRTDQHSENWSVFAAVLFLLAGFIHIMWGIAALAGDDAFVVDELLFGDLTLWGLIYLAIGAAQAGAAWLLATGNPWGRTLGVALAGLSAANAMLTFGARPLWAATALAVDLLVIYGLTVHGDRRV